MEEKFCEFGKLKYFKIIAKLQNYPDSWEISGLVHHRISLINSYLTSAKI